MLGPLSAPAAGLPPPNPRLGRSCPMPPMRQHPRVTAALQRERGRWFSGAATACWGSSSICDGATEIALGNPENSGRRYAMLIRALIHLGDGLRNHRARRKPYEHTL